MPYSASISPLVAEIGFLKRKRRKPTLTLCLVCFPLPGGQRRAIRGRGHAVEDQPLPPAGGGELGHGLRPGQKARRLHQGVPLPALDLCCYEGKEGAAVPTPCAKRG